MQSRVVKNSKSRTTQLWARCSLRAGSLVRLRGKFEGPRMAHGSAKIIFPEFAQMSLLAGKAPSRITLLGPIARHGKPFCQLLDDVGSASCS